MSELVDILKVITRIGDIFEGIINGLVTFADGFVEEVEGFPVGAYDIIQNSGVVILYVVEYIAGYIYCFFKLLGNIKYCFIFYLIHTVGIILYLPFNFVVFFVSLFRIPAYQMEQQFWDKMEDYDQMVLTATGYHLIHFPKNVRDKCYKCIRLKTSVIGEKVSEYIQEIEDPIFERLFGGTIKMAQGVLDVLFAFIG
jgi:hypothetical protein